MEEDINELKDRIEKALISHKVEKETRVKIFKNIDAFIHRHKKAWRVDGLHSFAGLVEQMRNSQLSKSTTTAKKLEQQVDRSIKQIKRLKK